MKKYIITIGLIINLMLIPAHAKVDLLIENSTIISPTSKHHVSVSTQHWVAIKGGRITKVSASANRPIAKKTIDAQGRYLIPGLTDSHTHLKTMPGINHTAEKASKMQQQFLKRQGANYLYYGVTQVIDPANTQAGISKFHNSGLTPDAFYCGAMPIYNGYNAQGIPHGELHSVRPYYVAQDTDPKTTQQIQEAHEVTHVVDRLVRDGAKCAKVYIEDGFGFESNIPLIASESLKKLTAHAYQLNLPTMAHANATDMQTISVDANATIMGHGLWNWLEEENNSDELPPKVLAVLDGIIAKDIAYQPTLNVIRSLTDLMVAGHLSLPGYKNVLPQWQIDWYLSKEGQWFANEMHQDWDGLPIEQIIQRFTHKQINGQKALKYLYQNNATILLASDTPPAPTYASQPGIATYMELKDMHKSGMDLTGILAAATLNNAKAYHLKNDYGSIESGKMANLLLLNSNPLENISAYDDINTVILKGKAISRNQLHIDKLKQTKP